ncbi:MAG TPA: cache domain-containing protein [Spirochaetota bacterium]|nr:cache domain-containing protein [Spirochaetota bacterium]HOM38948.1 cache domain-containing protein [Spirochaetota bacterium]HPQ49206.1 cache domain-containing protein [Spirochaetota bacterium]
MFKKLYVLTLILLFSSVFAQGKKDEKAETAKKYVQKGIEFLQKNKHKVENNILYVQVGGKWVTFGEILRDPKYGMKKDEWYLTIFNLDGYQIAHGEKKELEGKNLLDLKDTNGKEFVKDFMKVGEKGEGFVDYTWVNPVSKKIQKKNTYFKRLGKENIIVGSGYYME